MTRSTHRVLISRSAEPERMPETQTTLLRAIGRWSLVALTLNSVIGSAMFGLPGTVAALLGPRSPLAVLIAGAAMGVIMACFAEVASQFSGTGGPYLYGRVAFGRLIGILVGWTLYLAQCAAPAASANLFVVYLAEFWPGARESGLRFLIVTLLIGLLTVINLLGVRQGTAVSNIFVVAKILPLIVIIVAGLAMALLRPTPLAPAAPVAQASWLNAMVLLVFAYGGFETGLVPMGEARNPRRDAAFALFAALIICIVIYVLIQWVVVAVLGSGAASERPLADVARVTIGRWGATLVSIGALVSIYGYLSAKLLANPRITFALAEQGDLPRLFCAVSGKFHTPWFSIMVYALLVWGLALAGNFSWNVTLSVIARLFYYAVVCASLIALRRMHPQAERLRMPAGPVLALVGVLLCLALATQTDLSKSIIVAATFAAALLNWLWVRRRPASL
jgi:basic amino acid/polyamine antiporter, APA family